MTSPPIELLLAKLALGRSPGLLFCMASPAMELLLVQLALGRRPGLLLDMAAAGSL
jgi:hypothetical protein